jgi:tetratricopeptide (TPR) repeat protein
MTRHKRIPALAALLLSAAAGLAILAATGQFKTPDLQHESLDSLEKQIVSTRDGRIWLAYGDKLREAGRPDSAAKAYQRALELQPDLTAARLDWGLALAVFNADGFFDYANRLAADYPKLAVNLLERPELSPLHGDARWEPTFAAAQSQAAD